MRQIPIAVVLVSLVSAVGDASAAGKKRPARPPVVKPVEAPAPRPPAAPPVQGLAAVAPVGGAFAGQSLAAGGLRSGLPDMARPAVQCRQACTTARIRCDAEDATPECMPRWAQCVSGCIR